MPETTKIRVFSTDKVELAPCNEDRAYSLVRKHKAYFIVIDGQRAIVINKSSEQISIKEGDNK
ncbi:MAG: hypothetical protein WC292_00005 [Clostridia bacterium]